MNTPTTDARAEVLGVPLEPRKAFGWLLRASAIVLALHLVAGTALQVTGADWADSAYAVFNVNDEANVPTFFSATLWVVAGAVAWCLAYVSRADRKTRRSWLAISVISLLIAFDESAALHERLIQPVRGLLDTDGILHFAWVVPYALLVLVVALALGRFVWQLDAPVNRLIIMAGAIFVVGALGMELAEGYIASGLEEEGVRTSGPYILLYTIEESLELLGISVFVYALLLRLRTVLDARQVTSAADAGRS